MRRLNDHDLKDKLSPKMQSMALHLQHIRCQPYANKEQKTCFLMNGKFY